MSYSYKILFLLLFCFQISVAQQMEHREQGNLVMEDIPEIPARISEKLLQYQNTRAATLQDWLPGSEKGILISTRFGETAQLHAVEKPAGDRKQITFFTEPIGGAAVCPDSSQKSILFTKDTGGNEFSQIYKFDLATGNYIMLTDGSSQNGSALWSNKGNQFAFSSTKRNKKDRDIYITSTDKTASDARLLVNSTGSWYPLDWSPNDQHLIVVNYISANESYLYIADIQTGKLIQINPVDKKIAYGDAKWSKDGTGIYLTSDENTELKPCVYIIFKPKNLLRLLETYSGMWMSLRFLKMATNSLL